MNIFNTLYNQIITEAVQSRFDISGKDFTVGQDAEDYFLKLVKFNGYGWTPATSYQETKEHIDGKLYSPYSNKTYNVEVKSKKSGANCKNDILIELRSRGEEYKGWIYGKAEYIAFLYENKKQVYPYKNDIFVFINRAKLQELTERLTGTKWVLEDNKLVFKYDSANLVDDTCSAIAPKLYMRGINDPWSVITRIPLTKILGSLQKDKDYFVMKFVESKTAREVKAKDEDLQRYKFKSL